MYNIAFGLIKRIVYRFRVYLRFVLLRALPSRKQDIVDGFHRFYYDSRLLGGTWDSTTFLGIPVQKCPLDLFTYQEILWDVKPDLIIECGTAYGGGALFLASICDSMGQGHVVTVDITELENRPEHPRISYLLGSSVSAEIVDQVKKHTQGKNSILVILDSDHRKEHVLEELRIYHPFVTMGSYLIVEDTNVNGHPVCPEHGPGPMEALQVFLEECEGFEVDKSREKHYLTFNPRGYLRRCR